MALETTQIRALMKIRNICRNPDQYDETPLLNLERIDTIIDDILTEG